MNDSGWRTASWTVLRYLVFNPRSTIAEIVSGTGLDSKTASDVLVRLCEDGDSRMDVLSDPMQGEDESELYRQELNRIVGRVTWSAELREDAPVQIAESLDEEERRLLAVIRDMIGWGKESMHESVFPPTAEAPELLWISHLPAMAGPPCEATTEPAPGGDALTVFLQQCIQERLWIRVRRKGVEEALRLMPHALVRSRKIGTWMLLAQDESGMRMLPVDQIERVEREKRRFHRDRSFSRRMAAGSVSGEETAELAMDLAHPEADAYLAALAECGVRHALNRRSGVLRLAAADRKTLLVWVRQAGPMACVLSPDWLKKKVLADARILVREKT